MSDGKGGIGEVGTAVECVGRALLEDGRQLLSNICLQRFRILEIIQEEPYIIAEVAYDLEDEEVIACKGIDELTDDILQLEKEVYQSLQDVISLQNLLLRPLNLEATNLPDTVSSLSPQRVPFFRRPFASDFSFAVCDMMELDYMERQRLLECMSLRDRFTRIRKLLNATRDKLLLRIAKNEAQQAFD